MDALKRSMRWDEERFGREYDLDVFNIVAVSDFNMGAMENKGLNIFNDKYVLADPETGDRRRLRPCRGRHRARVFPQLDRQPNHLPRLVPALPEGRADRLPRPGVLRRRALARGRSGSPRCATLRRTSSPRTPGRSPIRCGPTSYREINNFYTATVYEKGAEVVPHAADAARRATAFAPAWTSISSAMTARRRRSRISSPASPTRPARDLDPVQALVPSGGHAGRSPSSAPLRAAAGAAHARR